MTEPNTKKLTLRELAMQWDAYKSKLVKYTTMCNYHLILTKHLIPDFGESTSISEDEVQNYVFKKLEAGLSRKTIHDIIALLRNIARYGVKHNLFEYSGWDIKYPTDTAAGKRQVLSIGHHKKLLKELSDNPTSNNIGVLISLCTGLRIGEVCALTWADVDLSHRIITVRQTASRIYDCTIKQTKKHISTPKTKNSNREVPISPVLYDALRIVKKQSRGTYVVGDGNQPKDQRAYRQIFSTILRRLNIPHITFHTLRHTFATRCIESQCDIKTVSAILGHSNVSTTLNLYVHPNLDQKRRCMETLNKFIGTKRKAPKWQVLDPAEAGVLLQSSAI